MTYESQNELMIERQALLISKHNEAIERARRQIAELEVKLAGYENDALMWRKVIKMVMEHESLQSIWDDLATTMKLIDENDTFKKSPPSGPFGYY